MDEKEMMARLDFYLKVVHLAASKGTFRAGDGQRTIGTELVQVLKDSLGGQAGELMEGARLQFRAMEDADFAAEAAICDKAQGVSHARKF